MDFVWYSALATVLVVGWLINIFGLPGNWVMVAAAALYAWGTDGRHFGWTGILVLTGIGILGEIVEFIAGAAGAKTVGGSSRAAVGAIVGGLLGGFFLTFIPIPVVSTIIGACLGAFIGALAAEYSVKRHGEHSLRVGWAAAKGRFWGILSKLAFGFAMLVVGLWIAWPGFGGVMSATEPTTTPASVPAEP